MTGEVTDNRYYGDIYHPVERVYRVISKPPIYCKLCRESIDHDEDLTCHLVAEHTQRELAEGLVSEWEVEQLVDLS